VYQAADFARNEPVLLLLGDTVYRSATNKPCALQLIEKYERYNQLMVSIHAVPLEDVNHYGILSGVWEDKDETVLSVNTMCEKPNSNYAEEFLGVRGQDGKNHYYSVFGQYILTPDVFHQLESDIIKADASGDMQREIELTTALDRVRKESGMVGVRLNGTMYDMGNPVALRQTMLNYSEPVKK
jgi:UTP-glucose-1-phosphate uridylyltransferase